MGSTAAAIVSKLEQSPLAHDFSIVETPRALSQPYLTLDATPSTHFFTEPTGVFNTAELLVNQVGLTPGLTDPDGPGLQLLLNHFVEDVQAQGQGYDLVTRDVLSAGTRTFHARTVVLAGGSIESPKLLRRSSMYSGLPQAAQSLIGRGLTDHPTSNSINTFVTSIGNVPISRRDHAKIIFDTRGRPDPADGQQVRYPFNVEMNINHEYWHLRDNDPNDPSRVDFSTTPSTGPSRLDIKFSFANCLDDDNEFRPAAPFGYTPEIRFHNQSWMDRLRDSRFPAVAGWLSSAANPVRTLAALALRLSKHLG